MSSGDPEHFKAFYADEWAKHKNDVDELQKILEDRFTTLKSSIKRGFGTNTVEYLEMMPTQRSEPSLKLNKDFVPFCCIWVSGSDKFTPKDKDNIWIRPDKIETAVAEDRENNDCWFYMKYPKARYVFRLKDILPYKDKTIQKNFKGVDETFVVIPASIARTENEMFDAINKKLHPS